MNPWQNLLLAACGLPVAVGVPAVIARWSWRREADLAARGELHKSAAVGQHLVAAAEEERRAAHVPEAVVRR